MTRYVLVYLERKLSGRCVKNGCPRDACEDHGMCQEHRDFHNAANRAYYERQIGRQPRAWRAR